jgi:tetratricopeptide (TPR) repeat protein
MLCRIASFTTLLLAVGVALSAQGITLHGKLEDLEAAAQRDSNDAAAQYNVALGYWSKKRYDDAARALRLAVTIEPMFAQGWLALGCLPYARRPKLRSEVESRKVPESWKDSVFEAARLMRRAVLIDPLVDLRIFGAIAAEPGVSWPGTALLQELFNPFLAFQRGDYALAFGRFDGWIQHGGKKRMGISRDSIPGWLLLYHGLSAAHLEQYNVAILDFQTLLDRDTAAVKTSLMIWLRANDYRYLLGLMHQRAEQWTQAIAMYHEALANDVGLYMAHVQLSKLYEARQLFDSGAAESRAAVVANPEDPTLLLQHGVLLTEGGYLSAAEDTLWRAMIANPRDSRIPYFLGVVEQAMQEKAEARAAFDRFLSLAPSRYERFIEDARARLATLQ